MITHYLLWALLDKLIQCNVTTNVKSDSIALTSQLKAMLIFNISALK